MFLLYHLLVIISIFLFFLNSVSEPLCILTSFPLRDSSKWIYRKKHQEELPCDAPVHGEISSNWSPGCTRQPEIRVTDLCQVPLEYIFLNPQANYNIMCMCISLYSGSGTSPLRLGKNWLSHREQRELFLALASIMALVMVVCYRSILMRTALREHKTNLSTSQSAGQPLRESTGMQNLICA